MKSILPYSVLISTAIAVSSDLETIRSTTLSTHSDCSSSIYSSYPPVLPSASSPYYQNSTVISSSSNPEVVLHSSSSDVVLPSSSSSASESDECLDLPCLAVTGQAG